MRRNSLIFAGTCGLLLSLPACENTERKTADERAAARQDIKEVGQDVREAGERAAGEVREGTQKMGEAAGGMISGRYERFEAYDDETAEAFASRADAAIQRLETDMKQARQKAGTETNEDLDDAQQAIEDAKKDIADVRGKSGTVVDDGRLGVAMNINQAQRQLSAAFDEMSQAKM